MPEEQSDLFKTLGGGRLLDYDADEQKSVLEFTVKPEFCHSGGRVAQGGFVTAWLDAAMAHAVGQASAGEFGAATLEIKVSFLGVTGPGVVKAEGWIRRMGRSIAFLEARLLTETDELVATATSTAKLARAMGA